jgi:hypothetical protein
MPWTPLADGVNNPTFSAPGAGTVRRGNARLVQGGDTQLVLSGSLYLGLSGR